MPSVLLALLCDPHFHAVVVERPRLCEVADVELYFSLGKVLGVVVTDTEVEPLVVAPRVRVHSHVQVVLPGLDAVDHVQIARLKIGVKSEFLAVGKLWVHALKRPGWLCFYLLELGYLVLTGLGHYFTVFVGGRKGKLKFVRGKGADVTLLAFLIREGFVHFCRSRVAGSQVKGLDLFSCDRVILDHPDHVEVVIEGDGCATLNFLFRFPA